MKKESALNGKLNITLTVASGVEKALKSELSRLGYGFPSAVNGNIDLVGDIYDVASLNVNLRTADRVYVKLLTAKVDTFDQIFDSVYNLDWASFLSEEACVLVNGKCVKSKIYAISACQSIIKKAISKKLCQQYKVNRLSEIGETCGIFFSIFKDEFSLYLNTSGTGLHKRGYRNLVGIAPIKETLASALLLYSDFYKTRPFHDPFCGSGTLAIEGAKIALNIAPNLERDFDFCSFYGVDKKIIKTVREKAIDLEKRDTEIDFSASDIDPKAIKLAKAHAERANLANKIKFFVKDVKDLTLTSNYGTIVTNPPYGERVYDKEEAELCYKGLKKVLENKPNWSLFLITSHKGFEKFYGKKADRVRKLYNSNKECNYYYYYGERNGEDGK